MLPLDLAFVHLQGNRVHNSEKIVAGKMAFYIPHYTTYIYILLANVHYVNPPVSGLAHSPSLILQFCEPSVPMVVNSILSQYRVHFIPAFLTGLQRPVGRGGFGQPVFP